MKTPPDITINGEATIKGMTLFEGISLKLSGGQWNCLLGLSGVGKTTLLRLIAGLKTSAKFSGKIISSSKEPISEQVAYMAQDDLLLPWATVAENVNLGNRLRGGKTDYSRVEKMLELVGLLEHANKKPANLSGGQRQRVALARTLMEDKDIVLLDEPFCTLDVKTRSQMQSLAFNLLKKKTVLMVTHDPFEAIRLGHRIVVMMKNGFKEIQPPNPSPPRSEDDSKTLVSQGELLRFMLEI